ncbi:MAG: dienelactone hydrolase family protein [Pseudomonadota bacterium]|nr:dienelactone hydrolase family protein [Pseudomonadota bacterium]
MRVESVEFPGEGAVSPLRVPGTLRIVDGRAVVVIAHGSSGPDSRGRAYAEALAAAGLSSLEIDMWRPRGLTGGLDRPKSVADTFPDVFGAFRYLTTRPEFDALRIGVLGFSWGGVLAMLTATRAVSRRYLRNGERFAAHAPLYPVCWLYNNVPGYEFRDLTGAPILLQCGAADDYDAPDAAPRLAQSLDPSDRASLSVIVYPQATHGFDQVDEAARIVRDPMARQGQGGEVAFTPNREAGEAARAETAAFFRRTLYA